MELKDLKAGQGKVDVVVSVVSKEEPREFQKFGKTGKVCNAIVKDSSGEMKLTLWNEQVDLAGIGDKVHIINGYVSEWQGEAQLSTGKFGSLEMVEKGSGEAPEKSAEEKESAPESEKEPTDDEVVEEEDFFEDDEK